MKRKLQRNNKRRATGMSKRGQRFAVFISHLHERRRGVTHMLMLKVRSILKGEP